MSALRADALAIFRDALAALDPRRLAREAAGRLPARRPVELWAIGKAAEAMAGGVRDALPVARGLVVGPAQAGHPVPDGRSAAAGAELLARAAALAVDDVVVLALSGGASALCAAPAWGLSLDEKVAATRAVAAAGAPIAELNAVRKHLSALKGGRLAAATAARVHALILSDVVGDDPATIGSGPTVADPTTFRDALAVAARAAGVPARVLAILEAGARGELAETPKPGDPRLARADAAVLAGPADLARAAGRAAERRGYAVTVETGVTCDVAELARRLLAAPGSAIFSGEPVIALPAAPGRGGRAQQTALLVARELAADAVVLCIASDGRDGPGADAGGLVDTGTAARAAAAGIDVDDALARCDAGTALAAAGDLVTTGPTGSNLCDLYIVLRSGS